VKRIVPNKQGGQLLETEELLLVQTKQLSYTIPLAISFRKDTRTFVRDVIQLTDSWINERMLAELINQPPQ